jgi:hypothetical protein
MGKFVDESDVTDRYEGKFPDDRLTWLSTRIDDVEADLILMVPSLGVPVGEVDPTRLQRVKALVADKVLELYRNPERARTRTSTSGPYSDSVTTADTGRVSPKGYFTDDEVRNVRLRAKRSNLGMAAVKPFRPHVPAPGDYWGYCR